MNPAQPLIVLHGTTASLAADPRPVARLAREHEVHVYLQLIAGSLVGASAREVLRAYWVASWILRTAHKRSGARKEAVKFLILRSRSAPTEALRLACFRLSAHSKLTDSGFVWDGDPEDAA